ncbi:MAG: hypothetical protein JZU55_09135 [Afipia sp.]|jgi:hypothetical protein|nr:hypothetical protein [Afipia sp.]
MTTEPNSNQRKTHGASEFAFRRHNTLSRLRSFLAVSGKAPKSAPQIRWEHRWTAVAGAWFAVLLAVLFTRTGWQTGLMVAATAFMFARGGDMLDQYDE